jgi:hypothetical protein
MQALGLVWGDVRPFGREIQEQRRAISKPAHFGAKLLFDRWIALQAEGGFVIGRDVPCRRLTTVLRNLAIYEPVEGGKDFRVRLAGSALIRRFARDITGRTVSEIFEKGDFEFHRANLLEVSATGSPFMLEVHLVAGEKTYLHFEVLGLKVLAPDRRSVWVLGGIFYYDWV